MIIGVPKEIKNNENRVALTPAGVEVFCKAGHKVLVEQSAGTGSGFSDSEYLDKGAVVYPAAAQIWNEAEMVLKVKEPLPEEYVFFRRGLILFTYLHLAPEAELTKALVDGGVTAVGYETIQLADGSLPLLIPMSEVAGRMAVQIGARLLEKPQGGKGVLLSGVPGVQPGEVVIVGGGIVGTNAAKMALGLGARVTVLDNNAARLRYLDDIFGGRLITVMSDSYHLEQAVRKADLLIGAVLIPGARAPKLVKEYMVQQMGEGSVIVDVAIDQGGSIETIDRTTTHQNPTYVKHGVVHYAVANMPGAVARTSTLALTNVTVPYARQIAGLGIYKAVLENPALARGLNVAAGQVTNSAVAKSLGYEPVGGAEALAVYGG
ncbi:alanine dehydrogenase [Paenibacillus sp. FSL R7-0273]|uniref:alanine dehydrogenase n=1 Tax=Paenibacillus sp. FSL R7-0273 TaxID=1536772 RepID=UPI0004F77C52|nr:alanine dehydrogenase [Paenibacillus sp. FSL R7-0273]AIQ45444.1 alanine dehydrogenase [Paenibacillus sp. FSL R7-0273]OMF89180.1 alanine dehydrogenase [Paenibacillus sp. FSL R7-0273]